MKNNDALKKHHFWIVAGLVPLFVLIAVVLMMTGVGGAIEAEAGVIKAAQTDVAAAKPPGTGVLKEMDGQKAVLSKKKTELWVANWDVQKPFFSWPKAPRGEFDKYASLKFGDKLKETSNEFEVFTQPNVYLKAYQDLPETVAPTGFRGGWQSVFRYVPAWGERTPKSEQIWLALEDLWVQRAVLDPIRVVNESLAAFTIVPIPGESPTKKLFRSRVWDLTLEVVDRPGGGGKAFKGKLKNRTNRLQVVGVGNTMRFNVWLDKTPGVAPVLLQVQGDSVEGETEVEFAEQDLPNGVLPVELAKVQQILDERTVPIRRIEQIRIGYLASKGAKTELKPPSFWPAEDAAAAAPAAAGSPGGPGADGSGGAAGGRGTLGSPGGGVGGPGSGPAAATSGPEGVLNANKNRYIETTEQIRRLPVAVHIIVDKAYLQDVLVAYANSPFRFLTVQAHFQRYRGPSPAAGAGGTGGGTASPTSGRPGPGSSPYGPPPGSGGPGYDDSGSGGINGSLGEGLSGSPSAGPGGPGYGAPGLSTAAVSEAQANSGLVELAVYGIMSLYEKVPDPKADETPADDKAAEKPKDENPADAPKADKPVEPAKADKPAGDAPKVDKAVETPKADKPVEPAKADKPAGDAPKADKPAEPAKTEKPKDAGGNPPPAAAPKQ